MKIKVLQIQDVVFSKLSGYAEIACHWFNNDDITQYLARDSGQVPENTLEYYIQQYKSETEKLFIIFVDGQFVDTCGLHGINQAQGVAGIGIVIGEQAVHSKGVGTQAMRTVCEYAFEHLKLRKIYLHVYSNNPRAIRCYEKIGFKIVGTLHEHKIKNEKACDEHIMELFARDYVK